MTIVFFSNHDIGSHFQKDKTEADKFASSVYNVGFNTK